MPTHTHVTPAARSYAQALFELAGEQNQSLQDIGQELRDLRQVIEENPLFGQFLADPGIAESQRTEVLQRAIMGRVSPLMAKFMGLLNQKGRLGLLSQIATAYDDLLDEKFGKIEVDVTVAHPLSPEQLEQVRQQVSRALGKDAIVHQYVDESIIGGLVLRVGDRLIDASVQSQLQSIRRQLLSHRPSLTAWTGDGDGNGSVGGG